MNHSFGYYTPDMRFLQIIGKTTQRLSGQSNAKIISLLLCVGFMGCQRESQKPDVSLSAAWGYSGFYRPGKWCPVMITVSSTMPVDGEIELRIPDSNGDVIRIFAPLPASAASQSVQLLAPMPDFLPTPPVVIFRHRLSKSDTDRHLLGLGQQLAITSTDAPSLPSNPLPALIPLPSDQKLILVSAGNVFKPIGQDFSIQTVELSAGMWPGDLAGYQGVDLVVVTSSDLLNFSSGQVKAITELASIRQNVLILQQADRPQIKPGQLPEHVTIVKDLSDVLPALVRANTSAMVTPHERPSAPITLNNDNQKLPGHLIYYQNPINTSVKLPSWRVKK